jgi:dienelactone hydrolase
MPTYVSQPDATPRGAVLILQEIFGVNAGIQSLTDLVASVGYLGIAPALFHRTDPHFDATHDEAGFAKGRAAAGAVDLQQIVADLTAAGAYAHQQLGSDAKVGTWGFCFGGSIAFLSATLPFVGAAVSFYGGQIASSPAPTRPPMLVMPPRRTRQALRTPRVSRRGSRVLSSRSARQRRIARRLAARKDVPGREPVAAASANTRVPRRPGAGGRCPLRARGCAGR